MALPLWFFMSVFHNILSLDFMYLGKQCLIFKIHSYILKSHPKILNCPVIGYVCQPLGGMSLHLKSGMFINHRKYKTDHVFPLLE
jgi:hypothetical protein